MVRSITDSIIKPIAKEKTAVVTNPKDFFNLTYGLFLITTKKGQSDNGCIVNTVMQLTDNPLRISMAVNKANYTYDLLKTYGQFNVSILTNDTCFDLIKNFGFSSGKDIDKFENIPAVKRSANGLLYLTQACNTVISAEIENTIDFGTHTIFIAKVTETINIS
ncbi:MAG: flavin reductase family protein, partial [Candidatus Cloacimonetes bacterium]|nr:flavin reductase family protein [Candidatus Cloacimonadota bacterium]